MTKATQLFSLALFLSPFRPLHKQQPRLLLDALRHHVSILKIAFREVFTEVFLETFPRFIYMLNANIFILKQKRTFECIEQCPLHTYIKHYCHVLLYSLCSVSILLLFWAK